MTSSKKYLVCPAIEYHNLDSFIDFIITSEDVENLKPDPEMLEKAMQALKVSPKNTVIIGDSLKDIKAGVNAGIDTVLFYPKGNEKFYNYPENLTPTPSYRISEFGEIV